MSLSNIENICLCEKSLYRPAGLPHGDPCGVVLLLFLLLGSLGNIIQHYVTIPPILYICTTPGKGQRVEIVWGILLTDVMLLFLLPIIGEIEEGGGVGGTYLICRGRYKSEKQKLCGVGSSVIGKFALVIC